MDSQNRISRKQALQKVGASALAVAGADALLRTRVTEAAGGSIVFYTYAVYSTPNLTTAFTQQTGINVVPANYAELNDMLSKLRASRGRGYDVISVASNLVSPLAEEGLLKPIDASRLANWKNLYPQFREADFIRYKGNVYGMPTVWGPEGLIYRTDKVANVTSWDVLWDAKYKGKLSVIDYDYEMVLTGAIKLGMYGPLSKNPISFTPAELSKIKSALLEQIRLDAKLWSDNATAEALLASGDVVASVGRILFLTDLQKRGVPVKLIDPKEGTQGWVTSTCISAGASNLAGSYKFLDYVTGPHYGVPLALDFGYPSASENTMTHVPAHQRKLMFLNNPHILDTMVFWKPAANMQAWTNLWNDVKASA